MNVVRAACNGAGTLTALVLCSVTGAIAVILAAFGLPTGLVLLALSLTGNGVLLAKIGGRLQAWTIHQAITAAFLCGGASGVGLLLLVRV
jgi:hypothetical protein